MAKNVHARIAMRRGDFRLDVEFAAPMRGVTAIFGPSGSGKTLLLRAIAGLERGTNSWVQVGDQCWQNDETAQWVPTHWRALGYVVQESGLFPHLSVARNLAYALRRVPEGRRKVSFDDVTRWLEIERLLSRNPESLSGGERQRVAIARALLTSPRLLLMDEPLASLDAAARARILPILQTLHETLEIPVLYVTHSLSEVSLLADYFVLIDQGRVAASGAAQETLARLDLPMAHADDAECILEATVVGYDEHHQLARLRFAGGELMVARPPLQAGRRQRVQVRARDVSVALTEHDDTSVLNVLPATVSDLAASGGAHMLLKLDLNGAPLLARITRRSCEQLDLARGSAVFAQIKAASLATH